MLIGTFFLFLHQDSQRGNVDAACAAVTGLVARPSQDLSYMDAGTALSSSVNNVAELDQKYDMYKPPSSAARKTGRSASPDYEPAADVNQYR